MRLGGFPTELAEGCLFRPPCIPLNKPFLPICIHREEGTLSFQDGTSSSSSDIHCCARRRCAPRDDRQSPLSRRRGGGDFRCHPRICDETARKILRNASYRGELSRAGQSVRLPVFVLAEHLREEDVAGTAPEKTSVCAVDSFVSPRYRTSPVLRLAIIRGGMDHGIFKLAALLMEVYDLMLDRAGAILYNICSVA